ncbi:MAG: hypothetical protein ACFFA0_13180 [Promethearchaeota archaeon]
MILLSLTIMLVFASFNFNSFNFFFNTGCNDSNSTPNFIFSDKLKTGDITSYDGNGEQINLTLHQSILDTSTIGFTNIDNANSFTEPFPNFPGYNTSFINITIENIYAPDKMLYIENSTNGVRGIYTYDIALGFQVRGNGTLDNFSICFSEVFSGGADSDATIAIQVRNAEWDNSQIEPGPTVLLNTFDTILNATDTVWYNYTNLDIWLDTTQTYQNYYFIWLSQVTSSGDARVMIHKEDDGTTDDAILMWDESPWFEYAEDPSLKIGLSPLDNIPNPEDISLKINDTEVNGYSNINGSGYWSSVEEYSGISGQLDFDISAEWWNVSCDVTSVQINYTKTDLKADSEFIIAGSGLIVEWNVTRNSGLNFFDSRIQDYNSINFTIPDSWLDASIRVFNGTNEWTPTINKRLLGNGYREIEVPNSGNGTYWYLTANSNNLLTDINYYVGVDQLQIVNFSNNVEFRAVFGEIVGNGIVNISVYSPSPSYQNHTDIFAISIPGTEISISTWDISIDADPDKYGNYNVQMTWNNDTAAGFIESYLTIVGDTEMNILAPPSNSIFRYGQIFEITVEYNDTIKVEGIMDANINYSLDNGASYRYDNIQYLGNGRYNITINVDDSDFLDYGFVDIIINASKSFQVNHSKTYTFHRQITTQITPSNFRDLGSVIRGLNVSYIFNYSDTNGIPISQASWAVIGSTYGFVPFLENMGNGNYTMHLDTDLVSVSGSPYDFVFNISSIGNETQIITLRIDVEIIQTRIQSPSWTSEIPRNSGLNQTFNFYFNDTTNDQGIQDLTSTDVTVRDNSTGSPWTPGWTLINPLNDGWYILNISLLAKNSGWYTLSVNVSKLPNYEWDVFDNLTFYLRGNYTDANLISISDLGGIVEPIGIGKNYTIFEGSNINIEFNFTDLEDGNRLIDELADSYYVRYQNIITASTGILTMNSIQMSGQNHTGTIVTSVPALTTGYYLVNITIEKLNYENTSLVFNLTIIERYSVRLYAVSPPDQVNAGDPFTIVIRAEYNNGSDWLPIYNSDIEITPYFNDIPYSSYGPIPTNSSGEAEFEIIVTSGARTMNLSVYIASEYYHQEDTILISSIEVIPTSPGLTFEDFIPYLMIIGAALAVSGGSILAYRGIVVPKKREKSRVLKEVKTIFDDAINLEHILVLYKGTGTCIYFKSFGSEGIDPELISGFITAICSFGKDLVCQEELNEITYGDKMLLLSDGEYIRVALVLSKKASIILRKNLMEFINSFEKSYTNELPNWRGQLNIFRNAGGLVDEALSTSIILPHEITYEFSNVKALKTAHSKDVLKVANVLMKESERNFFFIATLLKEAADKTHKDTAEIFMGIKELRDKKILMPIEIGAIQAQPISQQELAVINQKVTGLANLSQEEKQKLVNDLAQMGPAEREAYFVSLTEHHEIISAPIEEKPGAALVDSLKSAKKEINNLKKIAKTAIKEKDYSKTNNIYQNALKIAIGWELTGEVDRLNEFIRTTKIEDLRLKMKTLEKEAKVAVKQEDYNEASQKYKVSSRIASEIFKLGVTEMTKEVKRLSNKSKEYEKLI